MKALPASQVDGLVLAGGQSSRMGEDKASLVVHDNTLVGHLVEAMRGSVGRLMLASGPGHYSFGNSGPAPEVVADACDAPYQGPLSAIAGGLEHTRAAYLWVMPADCYGVTPGLLQQLYMVLQAANADIACVQVGGKLQPLMALYRCSPALLHDMQAWLQAGQRAVMPWFARQHLAVLDMEPAGGFYCNINRPDDYRAMLEELDSQC